MAAGGPSQQQRTRAEVLPAPVYGIQANKSLMAMDPSECIYSYNMIPKEYGMEVRRGYYMFADIDDNSEIRTVMEYKDSAGTIKVFAATINGIYDISAGGTIAAGSPAYAWPLSSGDAGFCSYHFFSNASGNWLLVCDERNGYVKFDGTTWTLGGITGPTNSDADLVFVMEFKERLWFVERGTGRAWYTAATALTGAATAFEFGSKFTKGGNLRALYNWTIDGGNGPDDYLVAVSDFGDVSAFAGINPSDVTSFSRVGNWSIGDLPAGRRVGSNFGGELVLLCAGGLISVTKLLRGGEIGDNTVYKTFNISRLIRNTLQLYRSLEGWHITLHPKENLLIVTSPEGTYNLQFAMNLTTQAWGMLRDVPALCSTVSDDDLYIGDRSGNIWIQSGDSDAADVNGDNGTEIEWSLLTSYQNYGSPGQNKRMQFIRPLFLTSGVPGYTVQARYDFDLEELFSAVSNPTLEGSLWGVGEWDVAVWGGDLQVELSLDGAFGMGRHMAVALKGRSVAQTQYVGADVMWDDGGLL